jgi:DNA-binding NarL/FixJ family response regulator
MINILIADDHQVVRSGLRQFLSNASDCKVAAETDKGEQALALLKQQPYDLVLLDIHLPDLHGLEVLRRIKNEFPDLPVLIFSMFPEEEYALQALSRGAAGYLMKDAGPQEILEAIHRAARGAKYLSPGLAEKLLAGSVAPPSKLPHEFLSNRELEVMLLTSKGRPLKDIADRLHLSPKTVSTYRARVLEKMGFSTNAELTRYVLEHKLDQ